MTRTVLHVTLRLCRCAFALLVALPGILAMPARAEVHVEGSQAVVHVTTTRGDAISDVLSAFAATFNVQYHTEIPLDAAVNATYSGSFGQVISSLLDGYNYLIKREQEGIKIMVYSRRGEVATQLPMPKAALDKGIVSQWR